MSESQLSALIVDDESTPREVLAQYIPWIELGFGRVSCARDGRDAWEIAQKENPDLIISDVKMPHLDGVGLCRLVYEHMASCRFIFLSGFTDKEYLQSAITYRAVRYVEKPIDLDEITFLIRELVPGILEDRGRSEVLRRILHQRIALQLSYAAEGEVPVAELRENCPAFSSGRNIVVAILSFSRLDERSQRSVDSLLLRFGSDGQTLYCQRGTCWNLFSVLGTDALVSFLQSWQQEHGDGLDSFFLVASCGDPTEIPDTLRLLASHRALLYWRGWNRTVLVYEQDVHETLELPSISRFEELLGRNVHRGILRELNEFARHIRFCRSLDVLAAKKFFTRLLDLIRTHAEQKGFGTSLSASIPALMTNLSHNQCFADDLEVVRELFAHYFKELDKINEYTDLPIGRKVALLIEANYMDASLCVEKLAGLLNLTPSYLCLVTKRDTGMTINQMMTSTRMAQAMRLLASCPELNISQVAERVGYQDGKYFAKVFSRFCKMNPRTYRELHAYEG